MFKHGSNFRFISLANTHNSILFNSPSTLAPADIPLNNHRLNGDMSALQVLVFKSMDKRTILTESVGFIVGAAVGLGVVGYNVLRETNTHII